jgi:ketosteroid isomerase-like protein
MALALDLGCTAKPSHETVEQELLEADRAFLQATVEDGLEGWLSFFTDDALRVNPHGQTTVGLAAIRVADAQLFEPGGLRLRWEPVEAIAFSGGEGGMTRGRYTLSRDASSGDGRPDIVAEGTYLTLWRREDGRFKVYLDTDAPDLPLEALID